MSKFGKKTLAFLAMGALALPLLATDNANAAPVGLELVLAIDISGSVDNAEYNLQKQGYVNAFNSATVQNAITGSALGSIAVTLVQWSGAGEQQQSVGWTLINSAASASAFAALVNGIGRPFAGLTAVGDAISFSTGLLQANNGFEGNRNVIDVSGDGTNNSGGSTTVARDAAVALGITINGLPIGGDASVNSFYTNSVIGGPGAFSTPSATFADFGAAIQSKLVKEIVGVPEPASMALLGFGLAALGFAARSRKNKA